MNHSSAEQARQPKSGPTIALVLLGLLAITTAIWLTRPGVTSWRIEPEVAPAAVSRTNLVLLAGRLCLSGQTNAFTGLMIEHMADGSLRSRSTVTNGLLHGLSEGWHTNGQLQVAEHFQAGVSHGLRTKWQPDGTKLSEAVIIDGRLHGPFRRWHENGTLAQEMEMKNGQPDGIAKAWFPNGSLKSESTIQSGKVVTQKFHSARQL